MEEGCRGGEVAVESTEGRASQRVWDHTPTRVPVVVSTGSSEKRRSISAASCSRESCGLSPTSASAIQGKPVVPGSESLPSSIDVKQTGHLDSFTGEARRAAAQKQREQIWHPQVGKIRMGLGPKWVSSPLCSTSQSPTEPCASQSLVWRLMRYTA